MPFLDPSTASADKAPCDLILAIGHRLASLHYLDVARAERPPACLRHVGAGIALSALSNALPFHGWREQEVALQMNDRGG
jgi:hypothetical protein